NRNFDYQIRFKGANYNTKVWLNGSFLGVHNGGFTPFAFNMNKIIKAKNNFLVVRIENIRMSYRIPSLFFDWFNWGGIYRDIDLMILNKNRLEDVVIKTTLTTKKKVLLMFYIISLEIFH
ncbi:MAG: sugar-binding domain-containing protein, partial [Candidatus Hodarchaeota archaeon]